MEPKIFWSAINGRGTGFKVRALILMGDWCGEENYRHHPKEIPAKAKSMR
jgi:hypothetical protein